MTHLPPAARRGLGEEPGRGDGVRGGAQDGSAPLRLGLVDFAEGGAGNACLPGAGLHAVLEGLSGPQYRCAGASDEELVGLLGRWAAVESRAAAARLAVLRELIRRRPAPGVALPGPRDDLPQAWEESTAHEVSAALSVSLRTADAQLDLAWELGARLPGIAAELAGGVIGELKARIIIREFKVLDDGLVRQAEALIIGKLAGKTPAQIAAMAASAAVRVDPEGARKRRERAEREDARVRFWREQAGTSALAAYGLPTDQALAANASIRQRAVRYRKSRAFPGLTMDQLRVQAFLDMINGVTAEARIAHARAAAEASDAAPEEAPGCPGRRAPGHRRDCEDEAEPYDPAQGHPAQDDPAHDRLTRDDPARDRPTHDDPAHDRLTRDDLTQDDLTQDDPAHDRPGGDDGGEDEGGDDGGGDDGPAGGGGGTGGDSDDDSGGGVPSRCDLIIPLLTLLGLAERAGESHGLGPLDPDLARDLAAAAAGSRHSEWSVTVTDALGYAVGHGLAKPARGRPGIRPPGNAPPAWSAALPARVNLTIPYTVLPALRDCARQPDRGKPGWAGPGAPDGWALTTLGDPGPPGGYGVWRLILPGGAGLTVRLDPVPVYECDHRFESHAYQPNDILRRMVAVRDGTCTFPACSAHARESDFEHATPYHKGGRTCACNAGARSRSCHRAKQSSGWALTQPRPGWHQWTTPAGRVYTQGPKSYPA